MTFHNLFTGERLPKKQVFAKKKQRENPRPSSDDEFPSSSTTIKKRLTAEQRAAEKEAERQKAEKLRAEQLRAKQQEAERQKVEKLRVEKQEAEKRKAAELKKPVATKPDSTSEPLPEQSKSNSKLSSWGTLKKTVPIRRRLDSDSEQRLQEMKPLIKAVYEEQEDELKKLDNFFCRFFFASKIKTKEEKMTALKKLYGSSTFEIMHSEASIYLASSTITSGIFTKGLFGNRTEDILKNIVSSVEKNSSDEYASEEESKKSFEF